jgi:predicted transcriptional regulator
MEIHFTPDPDMAAWLSETIARDGLDVSTVLSNALRERMSYDTWFAGQVQKGIDEVARGEFVEHEAMKTRFAQLKEMPPPR